MPEDAYFEYDALGPECTVCLWPIEDANTNHAKFHPRCHKFYRRHYKRLRERWVSALERNLTPTELVKVRKQAAEDAANEIASRDRMDEETML